MIFKMNKAITGVVVGGIFITIALVGYGCSHISIEKKEPTTTNVTTTSVTTAPADEGGSETVESVVQTEEVTTTVTTTAVTTTTPQTETQPPVSQDGKGLVECELPDMSADDQVTTGVVASKKCYLDGQQIIYLVSIDVSMGVTNTSVDYFCTYSTFTELKEGDALSVTYRQAGQSGFSLIGVTRAS